MPTSWDPEEDDLEDDEHRYPDPPDDPSPQDGAGVQYRVLEKVDEDDWQDVLNRWGSKGWTLKQLVSMRPGRAFATLIMERPCS